MAIQIMNVTNSVWVWGPIVAVALCLPIYDWWQRNRRYYELASKIPGPPTLPIIGNAHILLGKAHNEILQKAMQIGYVYGHVVRGWLGPKLFIFLSHPKDVELILGSSVHLEKSDEYKLFKPWLGNGLLISSGDQWRRHRGIIAPVFHQNIVRTFLGLFHENALIAVSRLEKNIGKEFDVYDIISETTVDILLETVMGTKRTSLDNKRNQYAMAVRKMCDIIHKRTSSALHRWCGLHYLTGMKNNEEKSLAVIQDLNSKVIQKKNELYGKMVKAGEKEELDRSFVKNNPKESSSKSATCTDLRDDFDEIDENDLGEKRPLTFMDLMVETAKNGEFLSDEEIRNEVNTIMFGGHETTAVGASFTLCLLGVHQDVQEKVYEELYSIFGDSDRAPTFADILQMKYLERVMLESLRLYPPVPAIARKLTQDVKCASKDYILPKGCTVVIATYLMHRLVKFANPNQFNPDNFLPENIQDRHSYNFIPFSAGPRSCVGSKYAMMNLKVLLSTILRNYKVKSNVKESEFKLRADIILKRVDGFRIELERRHA